MNPDSGGRSTHPYPYSSIDSPITILIQEVILQTSLEEVVDPRADPEAGRGVG